MATFDLLVSPLPANFSLAQMQICITQILTLHMTTPLSKVLLSQTQEEGNTHQFQVLTVDSRIWFDLLDGAANVAVPGLIRESSGQEFTATEWQAIEQFRLGLFAIHNLFFEPSLIQINLLDGAAIALSVNPTTVAHGTHDGIAVTYHAPQAGHLDWVGLYAAGATNDSPVSFQYVADGVTNAVLTFDAPSEAGTYGFRYLVADSYTDVARSIGITVT